MTVEEIQAKFNELEEVVKPFEDELELDAHMEFINSLKELVNKY